MIPYLHKQYYHHHQHNTNTTYLIGLQQRHPRDDPPALARAQRVRLVDAERLHDLQRDERRVPVREVLAGAAAGRAVAQRLDGQQVHGVGEPRRRELRLEERRRRAHRVDHDDGRLGRVHAPVREPEPGLRVEVGHEDCRCCCHLFFFSSSFLSFFQSFLRDMM